MRRVEVVNAHAPGLDLHGYDRASLLLAWAYDKTDDVQLLFGRVELRPTELGSGPATRQVIDSVQLPGKAGRRVYAGIVEMSAAEAVAWYEAALTGTWVVPPSLVPGRTPPPHRRLGPAATEPEWPHLNLVVQPFAPLPCVPATLACPRVHHRLTAAPHPTQSVWSDAERSTASAALAPVVGFRLDDRPHLWESLRLVLPNPIVRSVGTRLVPDGTDECLGVTLIPRRHAALADLFVTVWEERGPLIHPLARFRPTQPRTLVRARGVREATALTIDSDRLGRIYVSEPAPFIAAFGLQMHLMSGKRRVTAQRPDKTTVAYEVPVHGHTEHSLIGSPKKATTIDLLRGVQRADEEKRRATSDEEIWFAGNRDAAQARLRALIERASDRVWVVDYFFGAADAGVLLPAIGSLRARVRVLTSREGFGARAHEAARALERVAKQLVRDLRMQPIEVRVMQGQAEIHDRFLVVDDRVYLLGSSVNNYGERGTMLVRLRGTTPVLEAIEGAWSRALSLATVAVAPAPPAPPTIMGRLKSAMRAARAYVRSRLEGPGTDA